MDRPYTLDRQTPVDTTPGEILDYARALEKLSYHFGVADGIIAAQTTISYSATKLDGMELDGDIAKDAHKVMRALLPGAPRGLRNEAAKFYAFGFDDGNERAGA